MTFFSQFFLIASENGAWAFQNTLQIRVCPIPDSCARGTREAFRNLKHTCNLPPNHHFRSNHDPQTHLMATPTTFTQQTTCFVNLKVIAVSETHLPCQKSPTMDMDPKPHTWQNNTSYQTLPSDHPKTLSGHSERLTGLRNPSMYFLSAMHDRHCLSASFTLTPKCEIHL